MGLVPVSYIRSVPVLSLLFTLMIYHLFIHLGRKDKESYYLQFSLFTFCLIIFIFTCVKLRFLFVKSMKIDDTVVTVISCVSFIGMIHYLKSVYGNLFQYPKSRQKIFLPMYIAFVILFISSLITFFYQSDYGIISVVNATVGCFSGYYMLVIYIVWLIKTRKILKTNNLIIIITYIFWYLELTWEVVLYTFHFNYPFRDTYVITCISVIVWSFLLADKFNKEHKELKSLKVSLEVKIKERTEELRLANEQRLNTYINLAHEIRTPLTLITNYLERYINNHSGDKMLDIVKTNLYKLNTDITNSFNEEKFRKGIVPYNHNQITNFSQILSEKIILFEDYSKQKNLLFSTDIEVDLYVKAAPDAIDSLINNLVENAIKYTPEGGNIDVVLKGNDAKILFIVKDDGAGIPKELHDKIFDPYFQVSDKKQNYHGIGMGLYIVNRIVDSIGGTIKLNAEEDSGTEFKIELKRHFVTEDDKIAEYVPGQSLNVYVKKVDDAVNKDFKHSVLIVEDHLQLLQSLRDELKDFFNVYVSENGRKALEKLKSITKPDLIISDVMMDEMDGFHFLEAISSNSGLNSVPLIFLTAKTTENDKIKGLNLGAIDYIYKPFRMPELVIKAISIVNKSEQQKKDLVNAVAEFLDNNPKEIQENSEFRKDKFDYNCFTYHISVREKDIIKYLYEGMTYKMIGDVLNISEHTVSTHVQHIYDKTGVKGKNRTDLLKIMFG